MCVSEVRKLYIRMATGIVWCRVELLDIKDGKKVDL
jgi:hypothetical protein